jgi:hypothetical protein
MSNVLIGIIGVILFIGLALAGALFLGPRFQESTSNSDAAAVMSSLKQAADAAEMWRVQEGKQYVPATDTSFLAPGYLKRRLANPAPAAKTEATDYFFTLKFDNNMHQYDGPEPMYAAKYVTAVLGAESDTRARAACQAISRTYGVATIPDYRTNGDPQPASPSGCIISYSLRSTETDPYGTYVAYQRIAPVGQSIVQAVGN